MKFERGDYLTAEQVKDLPVGAAVVLHGVDRRGFHTMLDCTVIKSQKTKKLSYFDRTVGFTKVITIRELDGKQRYYTFDGMVD